MSEIHVRRATTADWLWIEENADVIGGSQVVSRGTLRTLRDHDGFVAFHEHGNDTPSGFAVLRSDELLAIAAIQQWRGVGTILLNHCEAQATEQGFSSIWLVTTNDNLDAMRFYQSRGYFFSELHPGAFETVKRLKGIEGQILGHFDIPLRDEIVFRKNL